MTTKTTAVSVAVESPVGQLTLVADDAALLALLFEGEREATRGLTARVRLDVDVAEPPLAMPTSHPVLALAARELFDYFAGTLRQFTVPLRLFGTDFQRRAWQALCMIPFGETRTYGEQAALLRDINMSRAVGAANGRNPIGIIVPCHRVIGADGALVGFGGGLPVKRWLLEHERRVATPQLFAEKLPALSATPASGVH